MLAVLDPELALSCFRRGGRLLLQSGEGNIESFRSTFVAPTIFLSLISLQVSIKWAVLKETTVGAVSLGHVPEMRKSSLP